MAWRDELNFDPIETLLPLLRTYTIILTHFLCFVNSQTREKSFVFQTKTRQLAGRPVHLTGNFSAY